MGGLGSLEAMNPVVPGGPGGLSWREKSIRPGRAGRKGYRWPLPASRGGPVQGGLFSRATLLITPAGEAQPGLFSPRPPPPTTHPYGLPRRQGSSQPTRQPQRQAACQGLGSALTRPRQGLAGLPLSVAGPISSGGTQPGAVQAKGAPAVPARGQAPGNCGGKTSPDTGPGCRARPPGGHAPGGTRRPEEVQGRVGWEDLQGGGNLASQVQAAMAPQDSGPGPLDQIALDDLHGGPGGRDRGTPARQTTGGS